MVTDDLRKSIEQQDGLPFPGVWKGIQGQLVQAKVCPGDQLCVGHDLVADPSSNLEGDCVIVDGGIKVPDPLYVGGKITFRVNNKNRCTGS